MVRWIGGKDDLPFLVLGFLNYRCDWHIRLALQVWFYS